MPFVLGQVREQKTKEKARVIEDVKGMARAQESPRLVKEREARNFVGRSGEPSDGQRVEPGDTNAPTLPQKHVNALSVPVTPSYPPVQSSASCVAPSYVGALTREDFWIMAVQSFTLNVENGESSCLDTGSEEHVCNPDFPQEALCCLILAAPSLKM